MHRASWLPLLTLALFGFDDFSEAAVECEHAVAQLKACCPAYEIPTTTCPTGCLSRRLAFTEETSLCLQETSCFEMQEVGEDGLTMCERVEDGLLAREEDLDDDRVEGVCP